MTDHPNDVDPTAARSVEEFAGCLRRVRARADNISYRQLEHWGRLHHSPLPRSTIVDILAGRRLPRKSTLIAFLQACRVDPHTDLRWESTWNRLSEHRAAPSGLTTAADVPTTDPATADALARAEQIIQESKAIRAVAEKEAAQLLADAQRQVEHMHAQAEQELRRRRRLTAQLTADVRAAGLLRIGANYLNDLEWDGLFADAHELDIFAAYGQTWRNLHARQLHHLAERPGTRIRVFLPDTTDPSTMSVLADRFAIAPDELIRRIEATRDDYEKMRQPGGARIEVYYRPGDRIFSFYRFDETAVIGFYSHNPNRLASIPAFVCTAPGGLYQFVSDELRAIEQQSRIAPETGAAEL
jgi:hypothetical protein